MGFFGQILSFFSFTRRDDTTVDDLQETYNLSSLDNLLATRYIEHELSPAKTDGNRIAILNQAIKSPEIQSIIKNKALGYFGSGLTIQFLYEDEELTKKVEKAFKQWQEKENCDLRGMHSFTEMLDIASAEEERAGGIIFRHHFSPDFKFGYKIEMIPVSYIDYKKHDPSKNLFNGQQLDKNGARAGIWFKNSENDPSKFVDISELVVFIPAWVDAKQLTPIPKLLAIAAHLKGIEEYRNAEIQMSIKAASRPFFWFTSLFADVLGKTKNAFQSNGAQQQTNLALAKMIELTKKKLTNEHLLALPSEDKVQQIIADRASILNILTDEAWEAIAGATGIPVSILRNSAKGNNFASLKALTQIFEKSCEKGFGAYEEHIIRPIIRGKLFKMMGVVGVPSSVINAENDWEITYMPATGRIDISPQDTMKQHVAGLEAGITTINSIAVRAGTTGEELMREVAEEKAMKEALDIEMRKKYNLPDPAEEQKKAEEQAKEQNAVKTEAVNNVNAMFQAFSQEIEAI